MALLELNNIGKIYVSEGAVSVGIRGVNLSFDRGEFVAITGQSGSGKSTLLNVISGMDSYEEGEMFIEGEPTSHYIQADWETYREKYISFIFQEYNIIDSFTVLENVELSLMHIDNPSERRKRALDLLQRVGLSEHIHHKGSHLSGGQKQRTVIARALAKDSPIILADEPTGNLDSQSSKEIIELLREVSKDKLLIMVTHSFEEVEACATREIRVFDGAVASDREIAPAELALMPAVQPAAQDSAPAPVRTQRFRNSFQLGWAIFKSKPKLTMFMCALIFLVSAAVFFTFASFWADIKVFFVDDNYLFNDLKGRVVIARADGKQITEEELETLKQKTAAEKSMHLDFGLDLYLPKDWEERLDFCRYTSQSRWPMRYAVGEDYGALDYGRYPEKDDEVVLRIPSIFQTIMRPEMLLDSFYYLQDDYEYQCCGYKIVGLSFYSDTRKQGEVLFTQKGFSNASAYQYIKEKCVMNPVPYFKNGVSCGLRMEFSDLVKPGMMYCGSDEVRDNLEKLYLSCYNRSNVNDKTFQIDLLEMYTPFYDSSYGVYSDTVLINPVTLLPYLNDYAVQIYHQASLLYSSDAKAKTAAETLQELGYVAVCANSTYKNASFFDIFDLIMTGILYLVMWFLILTFLAFFLRICTQKSMDAFKPDIAIMRSMGIRVSEIKTAVYVRVFLCVIPTIIGVPLFAKWIYSTTFGAFNLIFLGAAEYVIIFALVFIVVSKMTKSHIKNLFSENVRKALKGGNE